MKRKFKFILILWLISQPLFASVKISHGDNYKIIYSSSKLKEKDFEGTDFFLKNFKSPYFKDLNVIVFNWIQSSLQSASSYGEVDPTIKQRQFQKSRRTFETVPNSPQEPQ